MDFCKKINLLLELDWECIRTKKIFLAVVEACMLQALKGEHLSALGYQQRGPKFLCSQDSTAGISVCATSKQLNPYLSMFTQK